MPVRDRSRARPLQTRSRFGLRSRGVMPIKRNTPFLTDEDLPDGSFAHSSNQLTRVNVDEFNPSNGSRLVTDG